jgi:hypothetical protein
MHTTAMAKSGWAAMCSAVSTAVCVCYFLQPQALNPKPPTAKSPHAPRTAQP